MNSLTAMRWSRSPEYYTDEIPFRPGRIIKGLALPCAPLTGMIQEGIEANGLGDPPPPEVTRQLVDVPAYTPDEMPSGRTTSAAARRRSSLTASGRAPAVS